MVNLLKAGAYYFLGIFTLGFILGTIRICFLAPYSGPMITVLVEIPIMLLFAWSFCRFLTRRYRIPDAINDRLMMGILALALLLTGEVLIAMLLQAGRMTDFFMAFDLPENRIGLGAQIVVALFPAIQGYGQGKAKP